jgi:hypothetical protein
MARGIVNKQENSAEPLRKLINRRRFVQGLAVCGSVAALDLKTIRASGQAKAQSLPVLSGDRFHLVSDRFDARQLYGTALSRNRREWFRTGPYLEVA